MVVKSVIKSWIPRQVNKLCLSGFYNIDKKVVSAEQYYRHNTQCKTIAEIRIVDLKSVDGKSVVVSLLELL